MREIKVGLRYREAGGIHYIVVAIFNDGVDYAVVKRYDKDRRRWMYSVFSVEGIQDWLEISKLNKK